MSCIIFFFFPILSYQFSFFRFLFQRKKVQFNQRGHTIIKRRNNIFIYIYVQRSTKLSPLSCRRISMISSFRKIKTWIIEKSWDNYPIITFSKLIDNHPDNFSCHDDIPPEICPVVKSDNLLFHSHLNSRKV